LQANCNYNVISLAQLLPEQSSVKSRPTSRQTSYCKPEVAGSIPARSIKKALEMNLQRCQAPPDVDGDALSPSHYDQG